MRASIVALLVFALDRWTKHLVEITMQPYQSHTVIPGFFDIVRTNNTGVAFGLFAGPESPYRIWILLLFSLGALAALGWVLWRNRATDPYNSMAMAFIFGGAVGNVFDRLHAGSVTDFLDFYHGGYHWYTFNVADTAISIGAGLLLLGMLRRGPAPRKVLS